MYELIQVSEHCYYIQSPAKIVLVRLNDTDVCLIDSGSDRDAGRKVRQLLDKNGWRLNGGYVYLHRPQIHQSQGFDPQVSVNTRKGVVVNYAPGQLAV